MTPSHIEKGYIYSPRWLARSMRFIHRIIGACILFIVPALLNAQSDPSSLPLIQMGPENFQYVGGFRFRTDTYGLSRMPYSTGAFAMDFERNTVYAVGHVYDNALAEFAVPELINSMVMSDLNRTDAPLQPFVPIFSYLSSNPEGLGVISGIELIDGQLLINAVEYYDGPGDNQDTTLIIRDRFDHGPQ